MKLSDNPEKTTNPGVKQVWRIRDTAGMAVADVLSLEEASPPDVLERGKRYVLWHPQADYRHFSSEIEGGAEPLLKLRFADGELTGAAPSLAAIRKHAEEDLDSLDSSYKRLLNPHVYKVSVTGRMRELKLALIKDYLGDL
jgi:nicotinate phosphoribosyltransferase